MGQLLETLEAVNFYELLVTHIALSVAGLLAGIIVSLPVAVLVRNTPVGAALAVNTGNFGRAVPSLAILALMLPVLGFGWDNALLALSLLAISPILINASTGLREVDRGVVDSARGMGLSEMQILTRVQLPIAAPVIFAGIRTSAVQVVASATLATFIGAGGLGELIVIGIQRGLDSVLLTGSITIAILAIITELGFGALERRFTPTGLKIARQRSGK